MDRKPWLNGDFKAGAHPFGTGFQCSPNERNFRVGDFRLFARRHAPPLGSGSNEERVAWERSIREDLPAFLDWLLALEIPDEVRDQRFGVRYFIAPEIRRASRPLARRACLRGRLKSKFRPILLS